MEIEEGIQGFLERWLKCSILIMVSDGNGIEEGSHSASFKACRIQPAKRSCNQLGMPKRSCHYGEFLERVPSKVRDRMSF